jgi:hypothetical protein
MTQASSVKTRLRSGDGSKKLHIHQVLLAIYELNRNPVLQTPDPREEYAKGVDQAGVLVSPAVSLSRRIAAMDGCPLKPKRMHWRTYRRLEAELEHCEALGMARIMQSLVRGIR